MNLVLSLFYFISISVGFFKKFLSTLWRLALRFNSVVVLACTHSFTMQISSALPQGCCVWVFTGTVRHICFLCVASVRVFDEAAGRKVPSSPLFPSHAGWNVLTSAAAAWYCSHIWGSELTFSYCKNSFCAVKCSHWASSGVLFEHSRWSQMEAKMENHHSCHVFCDMSILTTFYIVQTMTQEVPEWSPVNVWMWAVSPGRVV